MVGVKEQNVDMPIGSKHKIQPRAARPFLSISPFLMFFIVQRYMIYDGVGLEHLRIYFLHGSF